MEEMNVWRLDTGRSRVRPYTARAFRLFLVALGLSACHCGDEADATIRTSAALERALADAQPGDVVRLGDATLHGSFRIPAGVTVEGVDDTLVIAEGGAAFVIEGGDTVLRGVTVRTELGGDPLAGVLALGPGAVTLEDVEVESQVGIGIVADGLDRLELRTVTVVGTLTDELLLQLGGTAISPREVAIAGLLVTSADEVEVDLQDVEVRDCAGYGVVLHRARGSWESGRVSGVAGTGVLAESAELSLVGVAIDRGRKSPFFGVLDLGFGLVISAGSNLTTTDLEVVEIAGFGILQDAATSEHVGARLVGNNGPGAWIQGSAGGDDPTFVLRQGVVQRNSGVGIQLLDVARARLEDTVILETLGRPDVTSTDGAGTNVMHDGLQVVSSDAAVELTVSNTVLFGHGRVGALLAGEQTSAASAGLLAICGHTVLDEQWSCEEGGGGLVCLRSSGPVVGPSWRCTDGIAGTVCTTSEADLLDSQPELLEDRPGAESAGLPDDESCRADARNVVNGSGLVLGVGLRAELDGPHLGTTEWECETEGGTRTCIDAHPLDNVRIDDRDNPAFDDGPGWTCVDEATGRRCTFAGNGLLRREGASTQVAQLSVAPDVAERDERVVEAGLENSELFQVHTRISSACDAQAVCAGFLRTEGVTGDSPVVGDSGLIDSRGLVRASVGGAGFEPTP